MPILGTITGIFDLIPGWVYAALLGCAMIFGCSEENKLLDVTAKSAEFHQQVAERDAAQTILAQQATQARAEVSRLRAQHAQEINDELQEEHTRSERAYTAGRDESGGLQQRTAAASAPVSGPGIDYPKALRSAEETAAAFGKLLGQCDRVSQDLGRNTEELASQVRGLIAQYESLSVESRPAVLDPLPNTK